MGRSNTWIKIYFDSFSEPPTIEECDELFLQFNVDLSGFDDALEEIGYEEKFVDHALFSVLGECTDEKSFNKLKIQQHRFMAHCERFSVLRPSYFFINHCDESLSPTCWKCRSISECVPSLNECLVVLDTSLIENNSKENVAIDIHHENLNISIERKIPFEMIIFHDICDGENEISRFGILEFMERINENGPYNYVKNGRQRNCQKFICSQAKRYTEESNLRSSDQQRDRNGKKNLMWRLRFVCGSQSNLDC